MESETSTNNVNSDLDHSKVEHCFQEFYTEVKEIEKRDSVLTSKQQIDRLLRAGSSYFNLNPYEVLLVDYELPVDEIKKKYKRLSILVHPDKNTDDSERAQQAFEVINRAWKILENEKTRKRCLEIVAEATGMTDLAIAEKRKKLKKEGKDTRVEEDDPLKYRRAVYVMTIKLFADMERKRRELEQRDMEERKRKRETEIEAEEKAKVDKEWQKNFEESREGRVSSWQKFQNKKTKTSKGFFKPPKNKMEQR
ncbi:dnaJ homolog subfamily C member 8-like [Daphnia carinata]|uniref:dnaJ homolog subfamily C member 8-like n=1 Tax=Daphnia carinata TaxID=120202 RepID=UPI00257B9550|nr:dnaJ homolog subfamily C member 8-like [Daphnia carinata]